MFCFQAEDGIRDLVRSRGLGDVYKRQALRRKNYYYMVDRRPPNRQDRESRAELDGLIAAILSLIHI